MMPQWRVRAAFAVHVVSTLVMMYGLIYSGGPIWVIAAVLVWGYAGAYWAALDTSIKLTNRLDALIDSWESAWEKAHAVYCMRCGATHSNRKPCLRDAS